MSAAAARHPRVRRATVAWAVAVVCWVAFIWSRSLFAGPESTAQSDFVIALLTRVLPFVGEMDPDLVSLVVRKGAHLTEYAVLGALASGLVRSRRDRGRTPAAALVVLAPFIDEFIQLHVPGRSGRLTDVLVDLCGMLLGTLVFRAVARLVDRRGRRRGQDA